MTFHDANLEFIAIDKNRKIWIFLTDLPRADLPSTICISGSTGILSAGTIEPDWFLSDIIFIGRNGAEEAPWAGRRSVWRTIIMGTDGSFFEVVGGEVEFPEGVRVPPLNEPSAS